MRTYGRVTWADGAWHIRCEPHVMLRAKRVFAQVKKAAMGVIVLHDTPSTSRDLQWFLERFPMEVEDEKRLKRRAGEHDRSMAVVQQVLARTDEPVAFELAVPPRKYQRSAAELVLGTGRTLLGDDVGLGKTASAICVISDPRARPAVVVTLTHLPPQWAEEFRKFAPQLVTFLPKFGHPKTRDLELLKGLIRPDVIVLNYHKLGGWAETLAQVFQPRTVVFDEIQEMRTGPGTGKYNGGQLIAQGCAFRMGTSATPIYGYGGEIYNVVTVLESDALGTREEFEQEWCSGGSGNKAKIDDPEAFGTFLRERGLFLRRTKADVKDEVPELDKPIIIPHVVDSDTSVLDKMQSDAAELARIILSTTASGEERMRASGEIDWRLRQATGIAKAPYVAAFVRMLLDANPEERVLLAGWHHGVYALWREALAPYGAAFYTGNESQKQKDDAKRKFIAGDSRVLVMSLRAGAGLDGLQSSCRIAVFGELDWSPGVHEQFIGRLDRDGQKDTVRAYFLHSEEGSDPIVVEVLGIKKAQVGGIKDPNGPLVARLGDPGDHIRKLARACLARAEGRKLEPVA